MLGEPASPGICSTAPRFAPSAHGPVESPERPPWPGNPRSSLKTHSLVLCPLRHIRDDHAVARRDSLNYLNEGARNLAIAHCNAPRGIITRFNDEDRRHAVWRGIGRSAEKHHIMQLCNVDESANVLANRRACGERISKLDLTAPAFVLGLRVLDHFSRNHLGRIDLNHGFLANFRSEEHTSELQSLRHLVCRLL